MDRRRLFFRILNKQTNVKFADFIVLVRAFGFVCVRTSGSHKIFHHAGTSEMLNLQNYRGEAKPYQIRQFLAIVEKHSLRMEK